MVAQGQPRDGKDDAVRIMPASGARNTVAADVAGSVVQAGVIAGDIRLPPAAMLPQPRQLPVAPLAFVGRVAELEALTVAAEDAVMVTVLAGAGGVGKTWLALHWAHIHRDEFPDGQLFVDLRGFSPDEVPVEPLTALRGFLDALGVDPTRLTGGVAEHAALFRSLLADKQMLIVLDNAATPGQVIPLLPGTPTCTVLITSRKMLTALITRHGARQVPLAAFDEREAHALLAHHLGGARLAAESTAGAELIGLCGRYPLALSIIASRAHARPHLPLAEFVGELRELGLSMLDDADPAASLPAVLSWSLRGLGQQQRTVFALLGIAPGPDIGLPAAVSLTALPLPRVRAMLRDLEEDSLLDRQAHGRYVMHDVIRDYAAVTALRELSGDVRQAALNRVLDHYLHTANAAARLLHPLQPPLPLEPLHPDAVPEALADQEAAVAWYQAELPVLRAAITRAAELGFDGHVWRLPWVLHVFMYQATHRYGELAELQRIALAAAERIGDPLGRGCATHGQGTALILLGRHAEAVALLHRAADLFENIDATLFLAGAYHDTAYAFEVQDRPAEALAYAQRSLELYQRTDAKAGLAAALNAVGWYRALTGDHRGSLTYCRQAVELSREAGDLSGEAAALDSIGYAHHHLGEHAAAIAHYRRALGLTVTSGSSFMQASILEHLGQSHAALDQHEQARTIWRQALQMYRRQGRPQDAERAQGHLDTLDHHYGG